MRTDLSYAHWWSGFPGAYCLKCGSECPAELELAGEVPPHELPSAECRVSDEEHTQLIMKREGKTEAEVLELHPWLKRSK